MKVSTKNLVLGCFAFLFMFPLIGCEEGDQVSDEPPSEADLSEMPPPPAASSEAGDLDQLALSPYIQVSVKRGSTARVRYTGHGFTPNNWVAITLWSSDYSRMRDFAWAVSDRYGNLDATLYTCTPSGTFENAHALDYASSTWSNGISVSAQCIY